ncbi:MAG: hypothetical protein MZV64_68295 [Ignavibacteriales bacterium]|nr:hypothetical protein [Ignavibacteriales bacterium]
MYDEFVRRAIEEDEVKYIRGRVSRIYRRRRKTILLKVKTHLRVKQITIDADMVVLATAMMAQAECFKACTDTWNSLR